MNAGGATLRSVVVAGQIANLKFRSSRATVGFILAAVATAGIGTALQLSFYKSGLPLATTAESIARVMRGALSPAPMFGLLLAVIGTAGEFRHRTASTTFLLNPRRSVWLTGQALVSALYGMLLYLFAVLAVIVTLAAMLTGDGLSVAAVLAGAAPALLKTTLVAALYALLGTGLGVLLADQTGAIVAALVWMLVIEPVIVAFSPVVGSYLPGALARQIAGLQLGHGVLPDAGALLLLTAYATAVVVAGTAVLQRRDLT